MNEARIKELQKEMKSLGILSIEADGNMSESLLQDAISVVKNSHIDIKKCSCPYCRFRRGEVTAEYFQGYLQGCIDEGRSFLKTSKKYGLNPGSIREDTICGGLAVIKAELDSHEVMLNEIQCK